MCEHFCFFLLLARRASYGVRCRHVNVASLPAISFVAIGERDTTTTEKKEASIICLPKLSAKGDGGGGEAELKDYGLDRSTKSNFPLCPHTL